MNRNFDHELLELINNLDYRPKLLLHSCCGPCSSYVISFLTNYFDITVLYYNPNIEPIDEYLKRKKVQLELLEELNKINKIDYLDSDYDNENYHVFIQSYEKEKEGGKRCQICFRKRLEYTSLIAKEKGYDYFGTTLTVSPYKNAILINNIGFELEKKNQVKWLVSDFKKRDGYKKSIELSKKYNLYRQHYCGCLYSLEESINGSKNQEVK